MSNSLKLIAHRGNTKGPNKEQENNPYFLHKLISLGIHIEIDLWLLGDKLFLGHDEPQYEVEKSYLEYPNFWIHAKNFEALEWLNKTKYHYFWHQNDDFTLTSKNKIWTYPDKKVTKNSIIVCHTIEQLNKYKKTKAYGVCTDYIDNIKI